MVAVVYVAIAVNDLVFVYNLACAIVGPALMVLIPGLFCAAAVGDQNQGCWKGVAVAMVVVGVAGIAFCVWFTTIPS